MSESPLDVLLTEPNSSFKVRKTTLLSSFTTFFAEWLLRGDDLIIHLFPRAGAEDVYTEGHFTNRCNKCNREIPWDCARSKKPCPHCGHMGLVYIQGRLEQQPAGLKFPSNMPEIVDVALDFVWAGDVAREQVAELNAYVIQLRNCPQGTYLGDLISRFCTKLDELLDAKN